MLDLKVEDTTLNLEMASNDGINMNAEPGGGVTNYSMLDGKPQINGVTLEGNKTFPELGLTTDAEPTPGSTNPVQSGGVASAISELEGELEQKQDALTFDTTPTAGSTNPVTSGGIYDFCATKPYLKCVGNWNLTNPSQNFATMELVNGGTLEEATKQPVQIYGAMNGGAPNYIGQASLLINPFRSDYMVVFPESIQWLIFLVRLRCGGAAFGYNSNTKTFTFKRFIEGTELLENKVQEIPAQNIDIDTDRYPSITAIRNMFAGLHALMEEAASATKTLVDLELDTNGDLVPTFEDIDIDVPVESVNGKTGAVSLDASDVGALPDTTVIPTGTSDLINDSGFITGINSSDVTDALGYTPYNADNPHGYVDATQAANAAPVQSVNGQTGAVSLGASDVGALPDTTAIPTKTSDLTNDSGFLTLGTLPIWDGGVQ